ncbi:MAG: type II secretion system protein [Bacilli bacterium]|jgi:prepilin-type N-terminal cleavage/methylation domain-containing protein|nr:type II secretion system protein [Bacilli bacterium]MDD2681714.1 type II secretion system protein [Bacilli bacterium]MDD3121700.1 type II secretion system protein [Bacilli bacterium]MDD4482517.1 type II secretion system protein [Bacilli bacterium]MDY0363802.1 type II secretion system protein [Bacilli bacterium]
MVNKKTNKGFTIIELVITLGVFAIVGTLITGLVVMASNFTKEQNIISSTMREINDSKEIIINKFSEYDTDLYQVVLEENKVTTLDEDLLLEFNEGTLNSGSKITILEYIVNIKFEKLSESKLIKCTFVLHDDQEFSFLINRRSE